MSYSIIGGADGPTSVFVAGKIGGGNWFNLFGLIFIILLLLPNIIYAFKFRGAKNHCTNTGLNILEQIGRYTCMIFMIFNIGLKEFSFSSVSLFLIYLIGNGLLMLLYWIIWFFYFKKQDYRKSMALAILPTIIFLLSGITLGHPLLIISSILFGFGHISVTNINAKYKPQP